MRWTAMTFLLALASLAGCFSPDSGDPDDMTPYDAEDAEPTLQVGPGPRSGDGGAPEAASGTGSGGNGAQGRGLDNGSDDDADGDSPAAPARQWATLGSATIRPGVQVLAGGSQCTSNFLFTSPDNATVYLGFAAHCVTNADPNSAADGCDPASDPMDLGTPLEVQGADFPTTLVYTSWGAMQAAGEGDSEACSFNDFALAQLDARDAAKANPAMLFFGGPTQVADPADVGMLDKVVSYGDSSLRLGLTPLSKHEGYVIGTPGAGGWTTQVYTFPQGIPGDSGSGVLLANGEALGILVTISYLGGSNGVTTLANAMEYAAAAGVPSTLATTDPLEPGTLPPV